MGDFQIWRRSVAHREAPLGLLYAVAAVGKSPPSVPIVELVPSEPSRMPSPLWPRRVSLRETSRFTVDVHRESGKPDRWKSERTRVSEMMSFEDKVPPLPPVLNPNPTDTDEACGRDEHDDSASSTGLTKVLRFGSACYKFVRPYAMLHTLISTICLFARVLVENPQLFTWSLLLKAFLGLIAVLLLNAYYCGHNGIYDADIDRVNKPDLPISSGDLSLKQAWFLVIFAVLSGLLILRLMNADLITTSLYCFCLLLATSYSAPPFRFKQSSVATSIVNPLMGGIVHLVGVLYATRASLGLSFQWRYNIRTFPAIYGPRKVTFFFTGILLLDYIGSMLVAICMPQEASANFFQLLWKLFALEFLLFPFI
ncbi:hypothetical protein TIFTF001_042101 [Ficus carica]|uniref:Uncharacterized protein n=1 Tax=Ficus carica TaxID=3494 RepID=A0AA87ZM27_FICCA|nr:hypothetical protein TIFTF001_042101 [Ficus carica]